MNTEITPAEILDQITLAQRLCETRLDKLDDTREPGMREILTAELQARKYVLANRHRASEFRGVHQVWWWYITNKAYITAQWDRRQMTDEEFHTKATELRAIRDAGLSRKTILPVSAKRSELEPVP